MKNFLNQNEQRHSFFCVEIYCQYLILVAFQKVYNVAGGPLIRAMWPFWAQQKIYGLGNILIGTANKHSYKNKTLKNYIRNKIQFICKEDNLKYQIKQFYF